MRPENQRMTEFLRGHGIHCRVHFETKGSMKWTWRLYNPNVKWTMDLAHKLESLGFKDFDNRPFNQFSGNGGSFSVSVRGHNELVEGGK